MCVYFIHIPTDPRYNNILNVVYLFGDPDYNENDEQRIT